MPVEAPFCSLRDALSRLLFKGVLSSPVSPEIFDKASDEGEESQEVAATVTPAKKPLEMVPFSKRRKLAALSAVSVAMRQKMSGDIKSAWRAVVRFRLGRSKKLLQPGYGVL